MGMKLEDDPTKANIAKMEAALSSKITAGDFAAMQAAQAAQAQQAAQQRAKGLPPGAQQQQMGGGPIARPPPQRPPMGGQPHMGPGPGQGLVRPQYAPSHLMPDLPPALPPQGPMSLGGVDQIPGMPGDDSQTDFDFFATMPLGDSSLQPEQPDDTELAAADGASFPGRVVATLRGGHSSKITTCAFSADASLLASGGQDKKIVVWGVSSRGQQHSLEGHTNLISDLRFSNDQKNLLASSSFDRTVRIWDLASPSPATPVQILTGHTTTVTSADFCRLDSTTLCSVDSDGTLKTWNIPTGQVQVSQKLGSVLKCVRYHPHRANIVAVASETHVLIYDTQKQAVLLQLNPANPRSKAVTSIDWSGDGNLLVGASEDAVNVWDWATTKIINTATPQKVVACAFLPNDPSTVMLGTYQQVLSWKLTGSVTTPAQETHDSLVSCVTACGGFAASASHDQTLKLWEITPPY